VFLIAQTSTDGRRTGALGVALTLGIALSVLPGFTVLDAERGQTSGFHDIVLLRAADLALAAAAVLSLRAVPALWHRLPAWLRWIAAAWALATLMALAAHPSWRGVEQVLRAGAAAVLIAGLVELRRDGWWDRILAGVATVAVIQAGLGLVQAGTGSTLALSPFITAPALWKVNGTEMGMGTFVHPYFLAATLLVGAGSALVAARRSGVTWPWTICALIIGGGLATTFSRSAALGLMLLVTGAALHSRSDRRILAPTTGLVAGFALVALLVAPGWSARASTTTTGTLDEVGSGRLQRASEAVELWSSDPVTGVGPGRYVLELPDDAPDRLPAHNLPLHAAAESGSLAGLASAAFLLGSGLLALRRGAFAAGVFGSLAPFFILDAYPYTFPHGFVLISLWGAMVLAAGTNGLGTEIRPSGASWDLTPSA
jgi:O-antigen ligase